MKYGTLKARLVKRIRQLEGNQQGDFSLEVSNTDGEFRMDFNFSEVSQKDVERSDQEDSYVD